MLVPSKRYRACLDELKLWTPVALDAVRRLDRDLEPNVMLDQPAFDLGDDGAVKERASGLSAGYALRRYFLALGQFRNLLDVLSEAFPRRKDQFERDLMQFLPRQEFQELGDLGEQVLAWLVERSRPEYEIRSELPNTVDDLADALCDARRFIDVLRGMAEVSVLPQTIELLLGSPWDNELHRRLDALDEAQKRELAYRMREYLSRNYVLKSMPVRDQHTRRLHETLFLASRMPGEDMYSIDIDSFLDQVAGSDLNNNDISELRRILESLERILSDVPFGELSEVIGDWGGMHPFDSINIIPSAGTKGACHNTLLATASGGGATSKGFLGVVRQVRRHLIDCFGRTRVVILLTDTWDPAKFRESRADIEAHRRRGVVFLTGVVSGRTVSPTSLPF